MKIIVLGAGVVGVATAYYLNKAGHQVTVIDRQPAPALETSFANGGQIAAAHADPWASPRTPLKALKWLFNDESPLLFHLNRYDPELWRWTARFLFQCTPSKTKKNIERALRIALFSRKCLKELRSELKFDYKHQEKGILHFYRNKEEFKAAIQAATVMRKHGLDRSVINANETVRIEPALENIKNDLVGSIYSKDDESGNARIFTEYLARHCALNGVEFIWNQSIDKLLLEGSQITGVKGNGFERLSDKVVVCFGSYSRKLLKPYGISLPIYPAKGYSVTLPLNQEDKAPFVSLTDDEFKLVFSRFENELRIAGTAEFCGYNTDINQKRAQFILKKTQEIFPNIGKNNEVEFWSGLRPKTPDSVPIIGKTKIDSLYLNTGHGTLGWTMACGSGHLISDLISGNIARIELSDLSIDRF